MSFWAILLLVVMFVVTVLINSAVIYYASKITKEYIKFKAAVIVSLAGNFAWFVVSLFSFQLLGAIAGIIVMLWLLMKFSTTDRIWPDAVLILVVVYFLNTILSFLWI